MTTVSRSRPSWRWLLAAVVVVTMAGAAAGLVVREVYAHPGSVPATPAVVPLTPISPSPGVGSSDVQALAGVMTHPDAGRVLDLLRRQFDGINTLNYPMWSSTITSAEVHQKSKAEFLVDFASTKDSHVVVHRIDPGQNGGLRVLVSFTSTQDVSQAPRDFPYPCIRWSMIFPVTNEDGDLKVDTVNAASILHSQCGNGQG